MITISVNNIDYNIPESWSDTTVKQHIDITEMKDRDESFRNVHMIHTYTGIPMELIRKMNVTDFHILINIMSFLKSPVLDKPINSFEFSGCTYYLVESMLKGETQDFLSVESVRKRFKDNEAKALPYIIAIVAKKEGESLDDYDPEKRAIDFLQLNYEIANSVWFFFAETEKFYSQNTVHFLKVQDKVMEASVNFTMSSLKQLVGLAWYKRFLRAILLLYIRFLNKSWKNFYRSSLSETIEPNSIIKFSKNKSKKLV